MNRYQTSANRSIEKMKEYPLKKLRSYGYDIKVVKKDVVVYEEFDEDAEGTILDLVEDRMDGKKEVVDLDNSRRFYNLYLDGELIIKEANEQELYYLLSMEHMLKIAKMDEM